MTEAQFRNKITWITFLFSVLVVTLHGYNIELLVEAGETGSFPDAVRLLENFFREIMATVAVPGFFIVSAYLFYRNLEWKEIPEKLTRRVKSVLVPYIAWTSLYYFGAIAAGFVPGLDRLVARGTELSIAAWADAVLNYTCNPLLWYLKQLILLIALAPLLYAVLSRLYAGAAGLLFLLAVIARNTVMPVLNLDALLYYCAGAYLALHGRRFVERLDRKGPVRPFRRAAAVSVGLLLCILFYIGSRRYYSAVFTVLFGLTAPVTVWNVLPSGGPEGAGEPGGLPGAREWMKYNFFLYAFHYLPVRGGNKLAALLLPHGAGTALLVYLALPVFAVWGSYTAARALQKYAPAVFGLLNGGR